MSELELRLEELGRELAFPPEPDLAAPVRQRSGARPFPWRPVALAFAVLVVAVATAFAVPQARSGILRFLHLGGATVVRVETLPQATERSSAAGLGTPLSPREAERRAGFHLALPPGERPRRVYLLGDALATVVVGGYGTTLLLSEFPSFGAGSLRKLTGDESGVETTTVGRAPALWIRGPHAFEYFGRSGFALAPVRVRGNVLLWVRGPLTLRLEGQLTKAQALELARRVR